MICSWTDNWTTDSSQIQVSGIECDKNFQINECLQSHEQKTRQLPLYVGDKRNVGQTKFRVGFRPERANQASADTTWSGNLTVRVEAASP
jgi:hypothetical protein